MNGPRLAAVVMVLILAGCKSPPASSPPSLDASPDASVSFSLSHGQQGAAAAFVDVDGDGTDDKVVGAPYAVSPGHVGALLVYRGLGEGFEATAHLRLTGPDVLGASLLVVGDVDGDGHQDFAAGALAGSTDDASLTGSVTVFRGGTSGDVLTTLAAGQPSSKFGYALAAGDLDGDGKPDLVVGAPYDTPDPSLYQAGSVTVFLSPDFHRRVTLAAATAHKGLGWAVAVGDVTGDGRDDLVLSATGEVLVFAGGLAFAPNAGAPDAVLKSALGGFGRSLAIAGDLDGDSIQDLLIGAPTSVVGGQRDTGSVFVVKGGPGPRTVALDASPAPAGLLVRLDGPGLFSRFGTSLAALGDVDGDGTPDFAVGAPMADQNPLDLAGRVFFFKGKDVSATATLASSTGFQGTARSAGYGASVVKAKGATLLIGAPRAGTDTGSVYVIDLASGAPVSGGATGGTSGGGLCCHDGSC